MNTGLRQKFIIWIFIGLFAATGMFGIYRFFMLKQEIMNTARMHGQQSGKLMAELVGYYMQSSDIGSINGLVMNFMGASDVQKVTIIDREGRAVVDMDKPAPATDRIVLPPLPIVYANTDLGKISISIYPQDMEKRLRTQALSALVEYLVVFGIVAGVLIFSLTRTITSPIKKFVNDMKDLIDRRDFTRRVEVRGRDEIGDLANGVNYLIERLEQFIIEMGDISARINEVSPTIAAEAREVKKHAEGAAEAISSASSSVSEMSASLQSFSENAESLSTSAEEASSAILEMNASNQEVATHTNELTSSVEDVTASVSEMVASIREVGGHVESLSSAAEETSASAMQIEATVREVERVAKESAQSSQQVSREAQEIGVRSIQETVKAIDAIKGAVSRYSDLVTRLGQRSGEIGKILGVIVEVTEKTNLLALNASILAAQAGEHGKGFGVVAEEIKALADRTAGSAQDIAKLISAVQKETRDAVAALSDSLSAVEEGVRRSREAGAALDKILQSSNRSSEMAAMIERAMTEQARGIKQVSEAFTNVKQMSTQIMTAMHAQTQGTDMILHAAEGMRDIARQVRNAMAEQARGGKQIGAAAENVTSRAGAIAAGTWEQRQAISRIMESMERIQDLPRQSVRRVEGMVASVETLGEQAALLNREIVTMTVRRGQRYIQGGALRMGVVPIGGEGEMHHRFEPLAEYLSHATGRKMEISIAPDFALTLKDLESNKLDLVFLTPMTYIEARKKTGVLPLVKGLQNGAPFMRAVIVARDDRGITRIEDLKGKRFAFGRKRATLMYLVPRAMLAEAGLHLSDLKEFSFLGHQDAVIKALLDGNYDAGALPEVTAKQHEGRGLHIVKTSIDIPEKIMCACKHLDSQTSDLVKKALLALDRKDPSHAEILGRVSQGYSGFEAANDEEYEGIRKLMQKILGADVEL